MCYKHMHLMCPPAFQAIRSLGKSGLLELVVPCDLEALLQGAKYDSNLAVELLAGWVKDPAAIRSPYIHHHIETSNGSAAHTAESLLRVLQKVPRP
jgi:hypothetical protein